jgi:hypothetical protein
MHACIHTYNFYKRTLPTWMNAYIHAYIHTYNLYTRTVHTWMNAYIHACIHACIHAYMHIYCTHRHTDTHTETHTHTCLHTYIHTHTHTYILCRHSTRYSSGRFSRRPPFISSILAARSTTRQNSEARKCGGERLLVCMFL